MDNNMKEIINDYQREKLYYIIYDNKLYPYKWINIPNYGEYRVSTTSLIDALWCSDSSLYKSKKAIIIDEMFFFYVADDEIFLRDNEITDIITEAVS